MAAKVDMKISGKAGRPWFDKDGFYLITDEGKKFVGSRISECSDGTITLILMYLHRNEFPQLMFYYLVSIIGSSAVLLGTMNPVHTLKVQRDSYLHNRDGFSPWSYLARAPVVDAMCCGSVLLGTMNPVPTVKVYGDCYLAQQRWLFF